MIAPRCVARGDHLARAGEPEEALRQYGLAPAAIRQTPAVALRIAACQLSLGDAKTAAVTLRGALKRHPGEPYATALLARAVVLMGRIGESRKLAEAVLREHPNHSEALKAACMVSEALGDVEAVVNLSRRLLEAEPTQTNATHYLYHLLLSGMSSRLVDEEYARVQTLFGPQAPLRISGRRKASGKIRVGYVSGLFGRHLDCFLPVFRGHDKARFEVHAFSDPERHSARAYAALAPFCAGWHDIGGLTNEGLASLVSELGIDVLIDCDGHFQGGRRLGVYRHRAATVQAGFLYPHRIGVTEIDYQLADGYLFPQRPVRASEQVMSLPLFACHERPPELPAPNELPALRNGFVTFGSFNQPIKIGPPVVEAWARILKRLPRSRLIIHSRMGLRGGSRFPEIRRRFLDLFREQGVSGERVKLVGNLDRGAHMAMYHQVDIALDPWPHNGMRTTCMALWMGVPVLSKAGDAMVSRMGVALLSEAGLSDWIAEDVDGYVEQACRRAEDLNALAALRQRLRNQVGQSRVMDGERFARSLEGAFEHMLREKAGR